MRAIDLWIEDPPSEEIARKLNATHAEACEHNRAPCFLRCGVERLFDGRWRVIPHAERIKWKREVFT